MRIFSTLIVGLLFSAHASAAVYKTTQGDLKWLATKVTGKHNGTIAIKDGSFEWDGKTVTQGHFDLAMDSIKVLDLTDPGYNTKLVNHLKSDDFFSTEKNPTGTFELTKATPKGKDQFEIEGNLTLKGIKKPIRFPATVKQNGDALNVVGSAKLDRTQWEIRYNSGKYMPNLGDKLIHDEFTVDFDLTAKAAGAEKPAAKKTSKH